MNETPQSSGEPDGLRLELDFLPVGDPARIRARHALLGAFGAGTLFVLFAVITTQDRALRSHSPWQDDPFDVVVSFSMFLVPLLLAALLARAQLCRRDQPLPVRRISDLLRGARAVLAAIGLTAMTDWSAVALGEHRSHWKHDGLTLVGMLGLLTLAVGAAALLLRRARLLGDERPGPDWVVDLVSLAERGSQRLGRLSPRAIHLAAQLTGLVEHPRIGIRRHPIGWALLAAVSFGLSLALAQGVGEHAFTSPASALRTVATLGLIGTAGMFCLLVGVGRYLRLVVPTESPTPRRRAVAAALAAAAAVPVAVAFRAELSWLTSDPLVLIATVAPVAALCALIAGSLTKRPGA